MYAVICFVARRFIKLHLKRQLSFARSRRFSRSTRLSRPVDARSVTATYTGWSKKTDPQFYFWDNFDNSAPILTILSLLQAEIYGT